MFVTRPFYFNLIRKYVITFGTLFNNIYITKDNTAGSMVSRIKIPIMFAPKEKSLARVIQDPGIV